MTRRALLLSPLASVLVAAPANAAPAKKVQRVTYAKEPTTIPRIDGMQVAAVHRAPTGECVVVWLPR